MTQQIQNEDEDEACVGKGSPPTTASKPFGWMYGSVGTSKAVLPASHWSEVRAKYQKPDIDHQVIRLIDGPLAGQVKRLEHAERIIVFTADAGAVQYIRSKSNRAYSEYLHLTKELQEQMEFDREMFKLGAMLDNPEINLRWVVKFAYSPAKAEQIRENGFHWDRERRKWILIGSLSRYGASIRRVEEILNVKVECEPIES